MKCQRRKIKSILMKRTGRKKRETKRKRPNETTLSKTSRRIGLPRSVLPPHSGILYKRNVEFLTSSLIFDLNHLLGRATIQPEDNSCILARDNYAAREREREREQSRGDISKLCRIEIKIPFVRPERCLIFLRHTCASLLPRPRWIIAPKCRLIRPHRSKNLNSA